MAYVENYKFRIGRIKKKQEVTRNKATEVGRVQNLYKEGLVYEVIDPMTTDFKAGSDTDLNTEAHNPARVIWE